MIKAVIYARYSSSSQTEQSIEGQVRVCREFAERNGYVIVGQYNNFEQKSEFLTKKEQPEHKCSDCYHLAG